MWWEEVKGAKKIVLEGFEGFEFFSHKSYYWQVREATTGMSVLRSSDCFKTLREAKAQAIVRLRELEEREPLGVALDRVRSAIREVEESTLNAD